jgi:hypothetical protein
MALTEQNYIGLKEVEVFNTYTGASVSCSMQAVSVVAPGKQVQVG